MNTKMAITAAMTLTIAALLYSLALYPHLPNPMPIHWNWRGEIDGWGDKRLGAFLMPGIMVFLFGLLMALPALSSGSLSIEPFRPTYNYVMVVCVALMGYIHGVFLQAALHQTIDLGRALMGGLFLFFAVLGNVMGKIRRNAWMGVRTPWTLASDSVWVATHRFAARLWTAAGLIGAMATLIGVPVAVSTVVIVPVLLIPIPYSYVLFKREG